MYIQSTQSTVFPIDRAPLCNLRSNRIIVCAADDRKLTAIRSHSAENKPAQKSVPEPGKQNQIRTWRWDIIAFQTSYCRATLACIWSGICVRMMNITKKCTLVIDLVWSLWIFRKKKKNLVLQLPHVILLHQLTVNLSVGLLGHFYQPSHQGIMLAVQTTHSSMVDIRTRRGISHSHHMLVSHLSHQMERRDGGGTITSQHGCPANFQSCHWVFLKDNRTHFSDVFVWEVRPS